MKAHPASSPLDTVIQSSSGKFTCETACENKDVCKNIRLRAHLPPHFLAVQDSSISDIVCPYLVPWSLGAN